MLRIHKALCLSVGLLTLGMLLPSLLSVKSALPGPQDVGRWSAVQSWPERAVHAHMLPTGKVLFWSYYIDSIDPIRLWEPPTYPAEIGTFTEAAPVGYNMFCSGHSFLKDGRLLVAGGDNHPGGVGAVGVRHASIYDPVSNSWNVYLT